LLEGEWHKQPFQLVATHIQSDDYGWDIREQQIRDIHNKLLVPYSRDGIPQIICGISIPITLKQGIITKCLQ
jgi:hypothetical protein